LSRRTNGGYRTRPAGGAILAQRGSIDYRAHQSAVITVPCPDESGGCGALPHERCADDRYASGRVRAYYQGYGGQLFHDARVRAWEAARAAERDARIRRACCDGYRRALAAAADERRRGHWAAPGDPVITAALALFDQGEPHHAAA
jgi:hypothetical protein